MSITEQQSREKKKNRLPGFIAFSTATPFNLLLRPVDYVINEVKLEQ